MSRSNSEIERNEQDIAKGARASGALRILDDFIVELQSDISSELARSAGSGSDASIRSLAGELKGLARLRDRLDTLTKKGKLASERRDGIKSS